jgi:hypothetical protein
MEYATTDIETFPTIAIWMDRAGSGLEPSSGAEPGQTWVREILRGEGERKLALCHKSCCPTGIDNNAASVRRLLDLET